MLKLKRRKVAAGVQPPLPTSPSSDAIALPVELLTVPQAARFACVSQPTIRRWIRDEGLRFYQPRAKSRIRIDKADLVKFLKGEKF